MAARDMLGAAVVEILPDALLLVLAYAHDVPLELPALLSIMMRAASASCLFLTAFTAKTTTQK